MFDMESICGEGGSWSLMGRSCRLEGSGASSGENEGGTWKIAMMLVGWRERTSEKAKVRFAPKATAQFLQLINKFKRLLVTWKVQTV